MTLIVTAHNGKDIVIGSDTLTTVEVDGVNRPDETSQKITRLNKKAALAISGYFYASTKQFITDFCYNNRGEENVEALKDKLLATIAATLALDKREKIQVTLVGFTNDKPEIRVVEIKQGAAPKSGLRRENYFSIGFERPAARADELLIEGDVESNPKIGELKVLVRDTINSCIREFSNDGRNQRLGGKPDVVVLRKK